MNEWQRIIQKNEKRIEKARYVKQTNDVEERELRHKLMKELKAIYNDKDFVCRVITIAKSPENWREILDYIYAMRKEKREISSDDILYLTLTLKQEDNENVIITRGSSKHNVAVAM